MVSWLFPFFLSILVKAQGIALDIPVPANPVLLGENQIGEFRVWDIPSEALNY